MRNEHLLEQLGWQNRSLAAARRFALTAGDDYELCFTALPSLRAAIDQLSRDNLIFH
ncbi:MAG: hypothetical protein R3F38_12830 [Gammaproteobacteria bacterium]